MFELTDFSVEIDSEAPLYSIGVVADMLETSVQTLRLYEAEGLILPFKKDSKHRLYSQKDIVRLRCIKDAITEKKFSIAAIKTLYAMIPCWAIKKCAKEERNACKAYNGYMLPCWMYKHENNQCAMENCIHCDVYKKHAHCESIKASIKKYTK